MSEPEEASRRSLRRASIVRRIRPGTVRQSHVGAKLRCLVLVSSAQEWAAVDLSSGAIIRNQTGIEDESKALFDSNVLDLVTLTIGDTVEPADPARPEAVAVRDVTFGARLSRRKARRLLSRLCAPEVSTTPVLSTRGPSVPYVDLDGHHPSIVLVPVSERTLKVRMDQDDNLVAVLRWAGTTQVLTIVDPTLHALSSSQASRRIDDEANRPRRATEPKYAVVGLSSVRAGHAKKAVLCLLAR